MRISKSQVLLSLSGFVITARTLFLISNYRTHPQNILLKQGFDFRSLKFDDGGVDHPKIGDKLYLENFKDLANLSADKILTEGEEQLILLVIINPRCKACNISGDLFRNIRDSATQLGIAYHPVSFVPINTGVDLKAYAERFGFRNFFRWNRDMDIPEQLTRVVTPTHILINKNGTVLHVWPGTASEPEVRKIMSEQFSSDLGLISETVAAANLP